mmetsp:Transcript_53562/g.154440  ORF Transcript_53562/g.154440 Transcript_53562/m.154440 type:complete len:256 (-) Transcript_53562:2645-3412(-)
MYRATRAWPFVSTVRPTGQRTGGLPTDSHSACKPGPASACTKSDAPPQASGRKPSSVGMATTSTSSEAKQPFQRQRVAFATSETANSGSLPSHGFAGFAKAGDFTSCSDQVLRSAMSMFGMRAGDPGGFVASSPRSGGTEPGASMETPGMRGQVPKQSASDSSCCVGSAPPPEDSTGAELGGGKTPTRGVSTVGWRLGPLAPPASNCSWNSRSLSHCSFQSASIAFNSSALAARGVLVRSQSQTWNCTHKTMLRE